METTDKKEMRRLVDEVMLRELADTVGRELAKDYAANIEGVTSVLDSDGVELHIRASGAYSDIQMKFVSDAAEGDALISCDDSEL